MSTTTPTAKELLDRATAVAKSERNLEIMDRATVLHGYLELAQLDPNNSTYRKDVEHAAASLQEVVYDCVTA